MGHCQWFTAILLLTSVIGCSDEQDEQDEPPDLARCESDGDCIIVPYDHCCGATKRAINREHEEAYNQHPEWQSYHEDDCSELGACQDDSAITEARCDNSVCQTNF